MLCGNVSIVRITRGYAGSIGTGDVWNRQGETRRIARSIALNNSTYKRSGTGGLDYAVAVNNRLTGTRHGGSVIQAVRPVWLNSGHIMAGGLPRLRHCRMTFGGMQETGGMLAIVRLRYRYTG